MRHVADMAGVAMSSVSRVLSGHPDVSTPMRDRVLAAVAELGYEPDFLAQSLRRGATLSVGFVVGDISNPLMADIASGAESVLRGAGYSMLLMNSENDPALDAAHIRFFQSRRVDGMVLSLASERKRGTIDLLAQLEAPVVVVDRDVPARVRASAVLSDHAAGMRAAVNHLLDLGHRRMALITGALETRPGRVRLNSMRDAIAARGPHDGALYMTGSFSAEHGESATDEVLDQREPPTAIVAGGNQLLIGCLRTLQRRGLEVGRDISLVTCDDVPLTELYHPPIASISRESVALGRTAAELLLARLGGDDQPRTVVLPTTFIPRASLARNDAVAPG
ncbi:MAG: LacI family DNA-binding transcriptional regulator [Chloroflexi bacterium]|nr:LacI family DNA-binding transcriptional regulator [Chloroflexota bacterium]